MRSIPIIAGMLMWVLTAPAWGKDYQIEVLIFANNKAQTAYESTHYQPIEELESEAETWVLPATMLNEEADAIGSSENYTLLSHLSWGQEALPTSEAAIYNLLEPEVAGWIKVYAGHLLFANLDLDFNGYRMTEKRRLKLNEQHFFDHPKFGVLLRVSRLEPEQDEKEKPEATGDESAS